MSEVWPIMVIILQLIFLEGILSIDNAAVIGALVSQLPSDKHVPWPNVLKRIGDWRILCWATSAWQPCAWVCWAPTWAAA